LSLKSSTKGNPLWFRRRLPTSKLIHEKLEVTEMTSLKRKRGAFPAHRGKATHLMVSCDPGHVGPISIPFIDEDMVKA
jgi:hypothetical protein